MCHLLVEQLLDILGHWWRHVLQTVLALGLVRIVESGGLVEIPIDLLYLRRLPVSVVSHAFLTICSRVHHGCALSGDSVRDVVDLILKALLSFVFVVAKLIAIVLLPTLRLRRQPDGLPSTRENIASCAACSGVGRRRVVLAERIIPLDGVLLTIISVDKNVTHFSFFK